MQMPGRRDFSSKSLLALTLGGSFAAFAAYFSIKKINPWDWLVVQTESWSRQLSLLGSGGSGGPFGWLAVQREVWGLLKLEQAHRLEERSEQRRGVDIHNPRAELDPSLPHVNNRGAHSSASQGGQAQIGSGMMQLEATPVLKDLVLVGGGHAHAYVLKNFGMRPIAGVQLTLITRDVITPYSGMLPGYIAGQYTKEECHIDLVVLGR